MASFTISRRSLLSPAKISFCLRCIHCRKSMAYTDSLPKWMQRSKSAFNKPKGFRHNREALGTKYISNEGAAHQADTTVPSAEAKESLGIRFIKAIGYLGGFYSRAANLDKTYEVYHGVGTDTRKLSFYEEITQVLQRTSKTIYECCADGVDYKQFFLACNMSDTFQSWFLILQLHVWMCLVRLKAEGKEGREVYRHVVELMWQDIPERLRALGVDNPSDRSTGLQQLNEQFLGLIFAYDEGLIKDDVTLSSALWRNMFHCKDDTDIRQLAALTNYVRRQIHYMDGLNSEKLLTEGKIKWLPLNDNQDEDKLNSVSETWMK